MIGYLTRLAATLLLTGLASLAYADGKPSVGAQGMAGAQGTFEFKPDDWISGKVTWWKDSDGIKPGEPGCHIGTDSTGKPNGRSFGEACLSDVVLVESNQGADDLHSHKDDVGHPDKFDCNAWCIAQGSRRGICQATSGPSPCVKSAKCVCN